MLLYFLERLMAQENQGAAEDGDVKHERWRRDKQGDFGADGNPRIPIPGKSCVGRVRHVVRMQQRTTPPKPWASRHLPCIVRSQTSETRHRLGSPQAVQHGENDQPQDEQHGVGMP